MEERKHKPYKRMSEEEKQLILKLYEEKMKLKK